MGILLLWSVLTPQPQVPAPQPPPSEAKPALVAGPAAEDPVQETTLGQHRLGVGEKTGGIRSIQVDGAAILANAVPGLLELEEAGSLGGPIPLGSRTEEGALVSEGVFRKGGVRVRRTLRPGQKSSDFRLQGELEFSSESQEEQEFVVRMVGYRPLHAASPGDKAFLAGRASVGANLEGLGVPAGRSKRLKEAPSWVASYGKSHLVVLQPKEASGVFHVEHPVGAGVVGWLELPATRLPPGHRVSWPFQLYAGPAALGYLREAGMEETLSFGLFSGLTRFLLDLLNRSYGWLHNYGLAICILSVGTWVPFFPLTWYGTRSSQMAMQKMAQVRPQEARIRKEHANNPMEMQRELGKLYRKHGVNPASGCLGCLPFLFTLPVSIALFQIFNRAPELRGASFLWIRDLSAPDAFIRFPRALPILGDGLHLLPILSTVLTVAQQKMTMRPPGEMTEEQKMQQQMFRFFPILIMVLFYNFPSGLMLYLVINSALMVSQQVLAVRSLRK